ncbi:AAA family ATPase [Rhizobium sp. ICMP 5592]|uniref:ATP-dependent nuclease n=1 Tax=Rhizobium sp. ICMP 5592 TaxID=2292445 RepID=UPI001297E8F3|nr:AAA family ATPase [Rhizobium sp. ICMP 5592]MQB46048.1 ATP-binding protein [Rhizobium sp. ICMP 5592]
MKKGGSMAGQPEIRRLKIERYRGLEALDWRPSSGVNLIVGGGDTGKSTVLEAIALLFSPVGNVGAQETDYFERETDAEFVIEATIRVPEEMELEAKTTQALLPWEWKDGAASIPDIDLTAGVAQASVLETVYVVRARGTEGIEVIWEIGQPDGSLASFPPGLRRLFGIVRLSGDDRNDRDLRLVHGSALDRLVSKPNFKAQVSQQIAQFDLNLDEDQTASLKGLADDLEERGLPRGDRLGLTSGQGISIGSLIGLMADKNGTSLPVASWGAGTRRMASLAVASQMDAKFRITLIDEIERGLEPYRLRALADDLLASPGQSFITTHSSVALNAFSAASLHYLDAKSTLAQLDRAKIQTHQAANPEMFLARVAIIGEGDTEVGFLNVFLDKALSNSPRKLGFHLSSGGGDDKMLPLLQAISATGLVCAALCDNDGKSTGSWAKVKASMGDTLLQWAQGCIEENIIAQVPNAQLWDLLADPDGATGDRARTLADRLGIQSKDKVDIESACTATGTSLRAVIVAAATGSKDGAPDDVTRKAWGKHSQKWFKSVEGGQELANKVFTMGLWPAIEPTMLPFFNVLRHLAGDAPLNTGDISWP